MRSFIFSGAIGIFFISMGTSTVSGQVASSTQSGSTSSASQTASNLQAYDKEQKELEQERQALIAQGASQQQLQDWYRQNSTQFAAQRQRAEAMAVAAATVPRKQSGLSRIPANASPSLKEFLTTRATLAKARTQIHNSPVQQAAASGQSQTFAQVGEMEAQEDQLFQEQNSTSLNLMAQQSELLSGDLAVRTVPARLVIPPHATLQMTAFLTTRSQLGQELIQLRNQYATADSSAREAALRQWYRQNAGQIALLRQQAQSLAQANTTRK